MSAPVSAPVREIVVVGFEGVELLDLAGPYEVFTGAVRLFDEAERPRVRLAAPEAATFASRNRLRMEADLSLADVDEVDLLVVPGGRGVRTLLDDAAFLEQLGALVARSRFLLSVCTGSLFLAKLGLLDGRDATTHHMALDQLRELAPAARVHEGRRWVEDGPWVLSAGVASGIDASFHVCERLWGAELAGTVAKNIEYPWAPGDGG